MRQYFVVAERVSRNRIFRGMEPEQVARYLGGDASPVRFRRGETLFGASTQVRALAFLLEGAALVYKVAGDGKPVLMNRLMAGEVFGMASLFCEEEYPTEVVAETACEALFWPRERVESAFALEPALSARYIALLSERIHFLNRRIEALAGDDVSARLLHLLRGFLPSGQDGGEVALPYSMSQLAQMLGVGRATLYRTLDALESEGFISRDAKRIRIAARGRRPSGCAGEEKEV